MTSDREPVRGISSVARAAGFEIRPHNCFACGELNAAGLHLDLQFGPDRCWVELALADRFEGWQGIAHGGILSTILDEVMGWALIDHDTWGLTARLTTEFKRPVEIGRRIRAEAWVEEIRRRVFRTRGRIVDAETGEELVRAEAVYVAAPEDRKAALKEAYSFRRTDDDPAAAPSATPESAGS